MPIHHQARCIKCSCTDGQACINAATGEPCHWIRLDRIAALGVCSTCESVAALWDHAVELAETRNVPLLTSISAVLAEAGVL